MRAVEITNVHFIEAIGDDNMRVAQIISSSGYNTNELIVNIDGTNSQSFDIYCNSTDICIIRCLSQQACTELELHCVLDINGTSNCFVQCEVESGVWMVYIGV